MEQNSNHQHSALLVMDVQNATVKMLQESKTLMQPLSAAIARARASKMPVIYVVVAFRKGYPEINPANKSFSALRQNNAMSLDAEGAFEVYSEVAPLPGEVVVVKKRVSAFTGSDLEVLLKSYGIKRIVLTGIATSGVVLSTLREAADKDYEITVLSDCCADRDEEVHRVLLTKVFPRQADVMTAEEWIKI